MKTQQPTNDSISGSRTKSTSTLPAVDAARLQKLGSQIIDIKQQIDNLQQEQSTLKLAAESIAKKHKVDKFTGDGFRFNHIVSVTQVTDDSMLLANGVTMDVIEKSKRPVIKDYYTFAPIKDKKDAD